MAVFVFTDGYATVNAVDLSDHIKQIRLSYTAELQDDTAMADTARSRIAGLLDVSCEIDFEQDFASGKVDATLFPLIGAAAFAVAVRADSGAIAATNPEFQFSAVLESYQPVAGPVGALAMTTAVLRGTTAITRDTTP